MLFIFLFEIIAIFFFSMEVTSVLFAKSMVVQLPVASVFLSIPEKDLILQKTDCLLRDNACGLDTQILLGDNVHLLPTSNSEKSLGWQKIEIPSQKTFLDGGWKLKKGYVRDFSLCSISRFGSTNATVIALSSVLFKNPSLNALSCGVLLAGTRIFVKKEKKIHGWYLVQLATGVSVYMRSPDAFLDSDSKALPSHLKRLMLTTVAKKFENTPYRWGCCSGFYGADGYPSGVDCSALTFLAHRSVGIAIPRDAHDQFLAARSLRMGRELKKGDLVFFAKYNSLLNAVKVHHVAMVLEKNLLIEATGMGCYSKKDFDLLPLKNRSNTKVRIVNSLDHESLSCSLDKIISGQSDRQGNLIFFGTFFN